MVVIHTLNDCKIYLTGNHIVVVDYSNVWSQSHQHEHVVPAVIQYCELSGFDDGPSLVSYIITLKAMRNTSNHCMECNAPAKFDCVYH